MTQPRRGADAVNRTAHAVRVRGKHMNIWIFECNDSTQIQCWERNLFGSKAKWPLNVKNGEYCLLYNYSQGTEHLIYGVYKAILNGGRNIISNAWDGEYPYQARVSLVDDVQDIVH